MYKFIRSTKQVPSRCKSRKSLCRVYSSTDISIIDRTLLDAYVEFCEESGWTKQDMIDNADAFYTNAQGWRKEVAQTIDDHYGMEDLDGFYIRDGYRDGTLEILVYMKRYEAPIGIVTTWYAHDRFNIEVEDAR